MTTSQLKRRGIRWYVYECSTGRILAYFVHLDDAAMFAEACYDQADGRVLFATKELGEDHG